MITWPYFVQPVFPFTKYGEIPQTKNHIVNIYRINEYEIVVINI